MPSLSDLKPGAVLTAAGIRGVITGSIRLEQDDFVWKEHLLDVGHPSHQQWVSVEDDQGDLVLALWKTRTDLREEPGGRSMKFEGAKWKRQEHGTANFTVEGTTPYPSVGTCEYHDYRNGEQRLSFEKFATLPWEVSVGRTLSPSEVRIEEG